MFHFLRGSAVVGVALMAWFWSSPALAYGLWVAQRAGETVVVYGKGPADRAYDPTVIRSATALNAQGNPLETQIVSQSRRAALQTDKGAAIYLVDADMGIFSQDTKGYWRKGHKEQVPGAKVTRQFLKYGLSITHLHGPLPSLPEQPLQIVPLTNPAEAEAGDVVRVRVLFQGRPLAGARLIPDYVNLPRQSLGKTDSNGEVELFVRNDGINVAAVVHLAPAGSDPMVDECEYTATLSFPAHQPHSH